MPDPQVSGSPARERRPTTNPRVSRAAPAHRGPIPDATPLTQPRGEARDKNRQENTEKGKPGGGLALVAVSTPCTPATVLTVGLARGHANGSAAGAGSPAQAPTRMHTEPGTQVAAQVAGLEEPAFQSGCGRHPRCNANTNSRTEPHRERKPRAPRGAGAHGAQLGRFGGGDTLLHTDEACSAQGTG